MNALFTLAFVCTLAGVALLPVTLFGVAFILIGVTAGVIWHDKQDWQPPT